MDVFKDHSAACRRLARHARCPRHPRSRQRQTFRSLGRGAIKGVQAAVLQPLQWDDNNSAFLITDLASQRKKKNCKKMILLMRKVKQWLPKSLNGLYLKAGGWRQFWTVASAPALITAQWLYSESLTQFRFLIANSRALWKDDFWNHAQKKREGEATEGKQANDIAQNTWRGTQPRAIWKAIAQSKMLQRAGIHTALRFLFSSQMATELHVF